MVCVTKVITFYDGLDKHGYRSHFEGPKRLWADRN